MIEQLPHRGPRTARSRPFIRIGVRGSPALRAWTIDQPIFVPGVLARIMGVERVTIRRAGEHERLTFRPGGHARPWSLHRHPLPLFLAARSIAPTPTYVIAAARQGEGRRAECRSSVYVWQLPTTRASRPQQAPVVAFAVTSLAPLLPGARSCEPSFHTRRRDGTPRFPPSSARGRWADECALVLIPTLLRGVPLGKLKQSGAAGVRSRRSRSGHSSFLCAAVHTSKLSIPPG